MPGLPDYEASQAGEGDDVPVGGTSNPLVRVLLSRSFGAVTRVYVSANGPFRISDDQGNTVVSGTSETVAIVSVVPDAITPGTYRVQASVDGVSKIFPTSPLLTATTFSGDTMIQLGATAVTKRQAYRGAAGFSATTSGRVRVVNIAGLEEYLQGVVKAEIGGSAPIEAMKAQAVAARTYTVHNLGRMASEGADLDDTTRSQGYLGVSGETPAILRAVRETRGQVIVYNGSPIDAMYCTECGGVTAQGPPSEPYLRPVTTPGCETKAPWTLKLDAKQAESFAKSVSGVPLGSVKSIAVTKTDDSGRATEVTLTGATDTRAVSGVRIRQVLGADILRSTLFTVKSEADGGFTFTGRGWGHGLGMCQCGAIARASGDKPESYSQILGAYYSDTKVTALTPDMIRRAVPSVGPSARAGGKLKGRGY
jgi:stage II sporulation protein D